MSTSPFDPKAADWDDNPSRREMTLRISEAILSSVPLSKTMSAMEFGCGTGLLSRELFPKVGKIVAIDLSAGMIEQLQKRIDEEGIQSISAQQIDIFTDPPKQTFDLIFSAMALHHVENTNQLLDCFVDLLNPGGRLALADLDAEDGRFHSNYEGFIHHGFDRSELMEKLRSRGFVNMDERTAHTIHKNDRSYPVFLISAQKTSV